MYDTSKDPLLETITLTDALTATANATVTRRLSFLTRSLTITNTASVPIHVYTEPESDYYVTISNGATKEIDVATDYYRIQAVGTPGAAVDIVVDILRSSIADSPTAVPDAGRALIDNSPIDSRTEPYRNIVQFDLSSATAYDAIVAQYPDAWNAYYETGAAPAYSDANALKLQDALSFWLYMNAGEYIYSNSLVTGGTGSQTAGTGVTTTVYSYTTAATDLTTAYDFAYTLTPSVAASVNSTAEVTLDGVIVATHTLTAGAGAQTFTDHIFVQAGQTLALVIINNDGTTTYDASAISLGYTNALIPSETTFQNVAATNYDFDPYNKESGTGIGTLENPQIYFDPTAYENDVDSIFTGGGLNDLSVDTIVSYDSTLANTRYAVRIDSVGASDTFAWSDDGGVTWTTGVTITGASQTLSNSLSITFGAVTGHTLNDTWYFNYRVSQAGLSAPFSKTVPRVTMDGTRTVGSVSGSGRNVLDSQLFSASYLALTEYQAVRQNGPKGPYDWGSPYATGKKTY